MSTSSLLTRVESTLLNGNTPNFDSIMSQWQDNLRTFHSSARSNVSLAFRLFFFFFSRCVLPLRAGAQRRCSQPNAYQISFHVSTVRRRGASATIDRLAFVRLTLSAHDAHDARLLVAAKRNALVDITRSSAHINDPNARGTEYVRNARARSLSVVRSGRLGSRSVGRPREMKFFFVSEKLHFFAITYAIAMPQTDPCRPPKSASS